MKTETVSVAGANANAPVKRLNEAPLCSEPPLTKKKTKHKLDGVPAPTMQTRCSHSTAADQHSEDPFRDMSDVQADDEHSVTSGESSALMAGSDKSREDYLQSFANDNEEDDVRDLDDGDRIRAMVQSGEYTYLANKMTEINEVREQARKLSHRLNLFYNPSMVRAVMEVLKAKEFQINKALANADIDHESFAQLTSTIHSVRRTITRQTNSNTVRITRRVLRRTRSLGGSFDNLRLDSESVRPDPQSGGGVNFDDVHLELSDQSHSVRLSRTPSTGTEGAVGNVDAVVSPLSGPLEGDRLDVIDLVTPVRSAGPCSLHPLSLRLLHGGRLHLSYSEANGMRASLFPVPPVPTSTASTAGKDSTLSTNCHHQSGSLSTGSGDSIASVADSFRMAVSSSPAVARRTNNADNFANLMEICIKEAYVSLLSDVKKELVRIAYLSGSPMLAERIHSQWISLLHLDLPPVVALTERSVAHSIEQRNTDFANDVRLLDRCTAAIELYHPSSFHFRKVRRRVKDCMLTMELMELQKASHCKLSGNHITKFAHGV